MTKSAALRLLRGGPEGVAEWNRVRPMVEGLPDLSGVDLRGVDLRGADLQHMRLDRCKMANAKLQDSNLSYASLEDAELWGARLQGAKLWNATLRGAILTDARLQGADFFNADARGVHAHTARFEGAILEEADVRHSDLRRATISKKTRVQYLLVDGDTLAANPEWRWHVERQRFEDRTRSGPSWLAILVCLTSGFGRYPWIFAVWSVGVPLAFGCLYSDWLASRWPWLPTLEFNNPYAHSVAPFYFSFVTFTTLGFGDIRPVNELAQVLVVGEVLLGYVMLGLLVFYASQALSR